MKLLVGAAIAMSFLAAGPARAQTIDLRSMNCEEAALLPQETLEKIAGWLDGFLADDEDPESTKFDPSATAEDAADLKAHCEQNPASGLLQAAETMDN